MRPYHSPSSIALGMRCRYAWALTYIDGQRDPDVTWEQIENYKYDKSSKLWWGKGGKCTNRSRSTALGKAIHSTFERWYEPHRGPINWRNLPGKIANSGCHLLPHPTLVEFVEVEKSIGNLPLPPGKPHAPVTALSVGGVLWGGYRDLLVEPTGDELRRLKLRGPLVLNDYKSTAEIARYALTPAELEVDVQANLYAIDVCDEYALDDIEGRWVYLETKAARRAHATDALLTLERAHNVIGPCAELARELDSYVTSDDAPKNPRACNDYGDPNKINCPHHKVNGGTCDVRRSVGALVQLSRKPEKKEAINMALTAAQQKVLDDKKAAIAARKAAEAAAAPPEDDAEEKSDGAEEESAEGEEEAPEAPTETVAPKTAAKPVQTTPIKTALKVDKPSQADTLTALAAELKAADKARDAVLAKLRAAVG